MLTHIHLKSGSSRGRPPLDFPLTPSMTIFVGPNNAGKSLLLREIHRACTDGTMENACAILDRLTFQGVDKATADADYARIKRKSNLGEQVQPGQSAVILAGNNVVIFDDHYIASRLTPNDHRNWFAAYHLGGLTLSLD